MNKAIAFPNFNIAVFNEDDKQVESVQTNLLTLWAEYAESKGFNPESVEILGPDYSVWRLVKTGWGWSLDWVRVEVKP